MYSILLSFPISADGQVWPSNTRWNMKELTGLRLPELRTIVKGLIACDTAQEAVYHLDNSKSGMHVAISVDFDTPSTKLIYVNLTTAQS